MITDLRLREIIEAASVEFRVALSDRHLLWVRQHQEWADAPPTCTPVQGGVRDKRDVAVPATKRDPHRRRSPVHVPTEGSLCRQVVASFWSVPAR